VERERGREGERERGREGERGAEQDGLFKADIVKDEMQVSG